MVLFSVTGVTETTVAPVTLGAVWSATFSPGGRHLATTGGNDTVRIWRPDACGPIGEVLDRADRHVTRELTVVERRTYLAVHG